MCSSLPLCCSQCSATRPLSLSRDQIRYLFVVAPLCSVSVLLFIFLLRSPTDSFASLILLTESSTSRSCSCVCWCAVSPVFCQPLCACGWTSPNIPWCHCTVKVLQHEQWLKSSNLLFTNSPVYFWKFAFFIPCRVRMPDKNWSWWPWRMTC